MRTAEEYTRQIKTAVLVVEILESESFKIQMSDKPDMARVKVLADNVTKVEEKIKYLSGQRRKAERIASRIDSYINTFKS
jgi:hypothetical protein